MTVGTQMQQAIAGIQNAAATMKTFALETQDQNAKNDFQNIAKNLDEALQVLNGRQNYIQQQEPQYNKL
ncbi:MAG TPA: hypothetical protein DC034_10715 [Clostridium sp.]|jgi:hypothetical protein|uniref:DUF1657 domain-containing protein n=1 Tax=Clostridium lapidicellarium TaxID=3240931 RepID=A0ABV4DUB2_9CLOT|nr:DUF1657 domain-containing protein [uncultured Clostridium sp.]NLU08709.1 DUF1657 domain-containing protein [Clostridiales bacterium]HBC97250.1 hypothetical protein [Clostridium sp.]